MIETTKQPESDPLDPAPTSPFPCPACGQLLAPSCRVCVACRQPIDLTKIKKFVLPVAVLDSRKFAQHKITPVRFSWGIFFLVFSVWSLAGLAAQRLLDPVTSQLAMGG